MVHRLLLKTQKKQKQNRQLTTFMSKAKELMKDIPLAIPRKFKYLFIQNENEYNINLAYCGT